MKASKLFPAILLVAVNFSSISAFAVDGINDNNHAALVQYYENQAKETETKLRRNKALLEEYEKHPYYYGRQGQDIQAHTSANIREYEKILHDNLSKVNLHKRMLADQEKSIINKAQRNINLDSAAIR
ncbi:MAG: hypothetical protein KGN35_02320 [Betaproteobacteria bacterium]|nr:hypothetical protein [Betaproteobacteria bacterium]